MDGRIPTALLRIAVIGSACSSIMAGCATYVPLPLAQTANLADAEPAATALDMNAAATIAVLNNSDLKAERARLHVAQAQAFAAGLLPDPQLSWSSDHPTDHLTSVSDPRYPEYNAYGFDLSLDLQSLLTHSSTHASADAAYEQARLTLLWQEWQTVAQARTLYVQQNIAGEKASFLATAQRSFASQSTHSQHALQLGDVALDQASGDLAVLTDFRTQLGSAQRSELQANAAMHTLLGIKPEVAIHLQPLTTPSLPEHAAVAAALGRLPESRPDLRALQAGYRSQEALVRKAILSQFPNISIGVTRARDVSDVHSTGVGVSMTLPLFDRGRGDIAIQQATREQLRAEYQARLDQASNDIWQLWRETQQVQAELHDLEQQLPRLQETVDSAKKAYDAGDYSVAPYLTLLNSYLTARATQFDLAQTLWTDSIALATLLGTQIQPAAGQ